MNENLKIALRVSIVTLVINLILAIGKLMAGIIGNSGAMVSDAIHSFSDVVSTFIVMIGVSVSEKKSDAGHQYGHERLECVAAIILSVLLAVTGIVIGYNGIIKIISGNYSDLEVPGTLALVAALISIGVKEGMFWYTRHAAIKINSGALKADAWHHRSDALSSVGAFIGILGARLGFSVLDPVASVIICIFIIKVSIEIFKDSIDKMVDKSCCEEDENKIRMIIENHDGVIRLDILRTRLFGSKIYVDVEISVKGTLSLVEAHTIAEDIHNEIEYSFKEVKHCMVHVNPFVEEKDE